MLLDGWVGFAISLLSLSGGIVGIAWGLAISQGLRRRVLSLEFDVADLQDRLLREIKSRAARASVSAKKEDQEFEEKIRAGQSPPKNQSVPWWQQYVHSDLKGN